MSRRLLGVVAVALVALALLAIGIGSMWKTGSPPPRAVPDTRQTLPHDAEAGANGSRGGGGGVGATSPEEPATAPPPAIPTSPGGSPSAGTERKKLAAPPTRSLQPADAGTATSLPTFPWPPPAASAEHRIRNSWVTQGKPATLSNIADTLEAALADADYETWRYAAVPRGFALITQLEQIQPDGTPRPGRERFRADLPSLGNLSFVEFLKALAKAPPGYYRTIVFVVTDVSFAQAERQPTEDEARHWLQAGLNKLPESIGTLAYGDDYRTVALVYEFRKRTKDAAAAFVPRSTESGRVHLEKAGIWEALTR